MRKKVTHVQQRYITQVEKIQERHRSGELAEQTHIASPLVMVTLPHSDPRCLTWERSSNNLKLIISSRIIRDRITGEERPSGLPYGVYPRLILYYLCHQVKVAEKPEIDMANSLSSFMSDRLGIRSVTGGKNGSATHFKEQLNRLTNAIITLEAMGEFQGKRSIGRRDILIADDTMLWWDEDPQETPLLPSFIKLSDKFFQMVMDHAVPLDIDAIKAVRNSSLGLDLYGWLAYRANGAKETGEPVKVPWKALETQLGCDYARHRDFKLKALKQLEKLKHAFPAMELEATEEHLLIKPGRTAIAPRLILPPDSGTPDLATPPESPE